MIAYFSKKKQKNFLIELIRGQQKKGKKKKEKKGASLDSREKTPLGYGDDQIVSFIIDE